MSCDYSATSCNAFYSQAPTVDASLCPGSFAKAGGNQGHITVWAYFKNKDSTIKVARKLAGKSFGTVTWVTNVGNDNGQVIMFLLTASEGFILGPMIKGLIERYRLAGITPPDVLYVENV